LPYRSSSRREPSLPTCSGGIISPHNHLQFGLAPIYRPPLLEGGACDQVHCGQRLPPSFAFFLLQLGRVFVEPRFFSRRAVLPVVFSVFFLGGVQCPCLRWSWTFPIGPLLSALGDVRISLPPSALPLLSSGEFMSFLSHSFLIGPLLYNVALDDFSLQVSAIHTVTMASSRLRRRPVFPPP